MALGKDVVGLMNIDNLQMVSSYCCASSNKGAINYVKQ